MPEANVAKGRVKPLLLLKMLIFLIDNAKSHIIFIVMSTKEIKYAIHESIENIDDDDFLEIIRKLVAQKYDIAGNPEFTEDDLQKIQLSQEQIKRGDVKTENQMDEMVSKWIKE